MGLLDLPQPLFNWVDQALGVVLPPAVRLLLWAFLGALLAMEIYRLLSPQQRLTTLKQNFREAQRRLNAYDGPLDEAWPLITRPLVLALQRIGLVLPATLAASLPLLLIILWLDTSYAHRFPESLEAVRVEVHHSNYTGTLRTDASDQPQLLLRNPEDGVFMEVPVTAPIPQLRKRQNWNLLLGNPAGYLPPYAPMEEVTLALPRREILPLGPDWLRGWEPLFFTAMILFALLLKRVRRIE